jgi:hypothetical protein
VSGAEGINNWQERFLGVVAVLRHGWLKPLAQYLSSLMPLLDMETDFSQFGTNCSPNTVSPPAQIAFLGLGN